MMRAARLVGWPAAVLTLASSTGTARGQEGAATAVTMREAVQRALDHNPTFRIAREEIARAQALVEEAHAQSIPTLSASATYQQLDAARVLNAVVTEPQYQLNAAVTLAVPLVNPRAWALWSHAGDRVDVTKAAAFDTRRTIAVATGHAYLAVFGQKRVLEANLRSRDTAKAHLDFAHARFEAGAGNRLDEVRARQVLVADEAMVDAAHAAVVKAEEALGVLAGGDVPLDSVEEPQLPAVPALERGIELATEHRSDVIAARQRGQLAHDVRRDNWTEYAPAVAGSFTPFYQNPPTALIPGTGWQAQIALTAPIYDGGLACGLGRERAALDHEAALALEETVRQARSDVRAAYEALARARSALPRTVEASQLADEALRLTTRAYTAGATTNLEVIDAEQTARDAEIQAEVAADTERQASLDALAAVGAFP
jgi:outer membrane protein